MNRFRLFFFFGAMAWLSLFKPDDGNDMIACAEYGAKKMRIGVKQPAEPSGVTLWLVALLALAVSLAWAVWLICKAIDIVVG